VGSSVPYVEAALATVPARAVIGYIMPIGRSSIHHGTGNHHTIPPTPVLATVW
jgi:hypothetical protein